MNKKIAEKYAQVGKRVAVALNYSSTDWVWYTPCANNYLTCDHAWIDGWVSQYHGDTLILLNLQSVAFAKTGVTFRHLTANPNMHNINHKLNNICKVNQCTQLKTQQTNLSLMKSLNYPWITS